VRDNGVGASTSMNQGAKLKKARTAVAEICYLEDGSADGSPMFLLHGFPDDPGGFDSVVMQIKGCGLRVIRPYLRGFGSTQVHQSAAQTGQAAALGQDVIDLADDLGIARFSIVGHDWGSRAGHAAAILVPERVSHLVAIASPFFLDPGMSVSLRLKQKQAFWYQLYFHTAEGKLALEQNRAELCEHLWRTWSPTWAFSPQELQSVLTSFRNPSFPEIVVSYYQHRWDIGNNSAIYETQQAKLQTAQTIDVPTQFIAGNVDGCTLPDSSRNVEQFYRAGYQRVDLAEVGHFPHREQPRRVGDLILDFCC
jgi:pimeloyl-ACP methyl ester carboxylesterase